MVGFCSRCFCCVCPALTLMLLFVFFQIGFTQENEPASQHEIVINRAVFGEGKSAYDCTGPIRKIVSAGTKKTTISSQGIGIPNRKRGKQRKALFISYHVDGEAGKLQLTMKTVVNIRSAILAKAKVEKEEARKKLVGEGDSKMMPPKKTETPQPSRINGNGEKLFQISLATVGGLMVQDQPNGRQFGFAIDIISHVEQKGGGAVNFLRHGIGNDMRISLEEAVRAVKVKYPKWERRDIRISFGDKYSEKDGGSAGAAYAILILSMLDGFEIDPEFAVTGDILVNGKIKKVGGISAKVRGGILNERKLIAIPTENAGAIPDMMVSDSLKSLWEAQLFSVSDLDAVAVLARKNRPANLAKAIMLFSKLQTRLKAEGELILELPNVKETLSSIVALAPNHESAKHLLLVCDGKNPKRLSRKATLRSLSLATWPLRDVIWYQGSGRPESLPEATFKVVLADTQKLQVICHPDLNPVVDKYEDYLQACGRYSKAPTDSKFKTLSRKRDELVVELQKFSANRETMEKMRRE